MIAKSLKARYLAPYYGRLVENRQNADKIVDDMRAICQPETRILLASLRSAAQVANLAARGHDTFT
ncbi:MAG: transaldolase, partial [Pseudomonadota bacterium]|nr:transaldolase [Pseudomonadota bacterium]